MPRICCGQGLGAAAVGGGFDAGHFRSVGSASHLRFYEQNVHGQTKRGNRWGAGCAVDYRIGLIERIGTERMSRVEVIGDATLYLGGCREISDKAQVEAEILKLLKAFQERTGLAVLGMDVAGVRTARIGQRDGWVLIHVNLDARLP